MLQQPNGYVAVLEGQRLTEIAPGRVDTGSVRAKMAGQKRQSITSWYAEKLTSIRIQCTCMFRLMVYFTSHMDIFEITFLT